MYELIFYNQDKKEEDSSAVKTFQEILMLLAIVSQGQVNRLDTWPYSYWVWFKNQSAVSAVIGHH